MNKGLFIYGHVKDWDGYLFFNIKTTTILYYFFKSFYINKEIEKCSYFNFICRFHVNRIFKKVDFSKLCQLDLTPIKWEE
jgi:hypothetical protein